MSETDIIIEESNSSTDFINALTEFDGCISKINNLLNNVKKSDEICQKFQSSILNFISFLNESSKHFNDVSTQINIQVQNEDEDTVSEKSETDYEQEDEEDEVFIVFVNDKVVGFTHDRNEAKETMEKYIDILRSSFHNICYYRSEYSDDDTKCSFYGFNTFLSLFTNYERLLFTVSYQKVNQM